VTLPLPEVGPLVTGRTAAILKRIERVLRARGFFSEPGEEPPPLEDSAMPMLWSASLLSRTAAGTGDKVPRLVDPSLASAPREQVDLPRGALIATSEGYSLHAATSLGAAARESLERLVISQCHWSASGAARWRDRPWHRVASCCARTAR